MLYIVHGDNLTKSRALILNQQKKLGIQYKEEFDILDFSPEELLMKIRSLDIFGNQQFFIINISGTSRSNMESYINVLTQAPEQLTVIILSDTKLSPTNAFIKNAAMLKAKTLEHSPERKESVFNFVDAVLRKDRKTSYKLLHEELENDKSPIELFSLLTYGIRSLASAKFENNLFKKQMPFVQSKHKQFANSHSEKSVLDLYEYFYNLDRQAKIGEMDQEIALTLAVEKMLNSK